MSGKASTVTAIWAALPYPAFVLDPANEILAANSAAENFASLSERQMIGRPLKTFVHESSAILDVVGQIRSGAVSMALYDLEVGWGDNPLRHVDLHVTQIGDGTDNVLLLLHPGGIVQKMDRSLSYQSAARSVTGMAAMLAHEIRNPLAGISGAAQLLAMSAEGEDNELTDLIQDEIRRIGALVEKVEQFGDLRPMNRSAVNIYDIIDRAERAAKAGFASHIRFGREFDPSIPPVAGDADQLLQVLQNLLKNAAEAAPKVGGTIQFKTAFRQGVRLKLPSQRREALPVELSITDNGPGIPETIQTDIFEPFVSSKANGSGLGLSLVSKIIAQHGGMVECESEPGKTKFTLLLPVWSGADETETA